MILGDEDIYQFIENDNIIGMLPFNWKHINPNSYDLTIGNILKVYENDILDCRSKDLTTSDIVIPESGYTLKPNILYLASTVEKVSLYANKQPTICATLMGKSSLGRLGLDVHISAGFIDTGFEGTITLELRCIHPLIIYPGMPIAQIKFEMSTPVKVPYSIRKSSKYQGQIGVTQSKMYENFSN